MRGFSRRIVSAMCIALLTVSAHAVSVSISSHDVATPVVITNLDRDTTAVTYDSFVATAPYVVVLDTTTHVPIEMDSLALLETRNFSGNIAVMQNANFERMSR